jgi:hypothetical protein
MHMLYDSFFYMHIYINFSQNEKQTREEQKKLTNLLEKILGAFEASAQVSNRISENSVEDEEGLSKKVTDLTDAVTHLRKEIGEFRHEHKALEVCVCVCKFIQLLQKKIFLFFQKSNLNLVEQTEQLAKARHGNSDLLSQLENKLLKMDKSPIIEAKITAAVTELKKSLKEMSEKEVKFTGSSSAGLTEADRTFLKELTNDTKDAIQDMRLEVLTASDKSEHISLQNYACFKFN